MRNNNYKRNPNNNSGGRNSYGNNSGGNKGRYNNQGGGGGRTRKNYPQLREKYLAQAKSALAQGDRVTAEYNFQHAEHCYRMMLEDGFKPRVQNMQHDGEEGDEAHQDSNEGGGEGQTNQDGQNNGERQHQPQQRRGNHRQNHNHTQNAQPSDEGDTSDAGDDSDDETANAGLPAFLTGTRKKKQAQAEEPPVQDWEERDAN